MIRFEAPPGQDYVGFNNVVVFMAGFVPEKWKNLTQLGCRIFNKDGFTAMPGKIWRRIFEHGMPDKTVYIQNRKGHIGFIGEDDPFLLRFFNGF